MSALMRTFSDLDSVPSSTYAMSDPATATAPTSNKIPRLKTVQSECWKCQLRDQAK